jgi:hypothetical protein
MNKITEKKPAGISNISSEIGTPQYCGPGNTYQPID